MIDFPFESKLSLSNIIGYWQLKAQDETLNDPIANEILSRIDSVPELQKPIEDMKVIEDNKDTIEWLMSAVLPAAMIHDQITAAVTPFKMEFFYRTKSFDNLVEEIGGIENMMAGVDMELMTRQKVIAAYSSILEQFYGITVPIPKTFHVPVMNKKTGLQRHFKISITTRFCEIVLNGELPQLSESDLSQLLSNSENIETWAQFLPPERFTFMGFALYSMTDVTDDQVTSLLKENLLKKGALLDNENLINIQHNVRSLLGLSDVNVGLASFEKDRDRFIDLCTHTTYPFDLNDASGDCGIKGVYDFFSTRKETLIIDDLKTNKFFGDFEEMMLKEGYESLLMSPLFYGDKFLGILKLVSPKAGDLNSFALTKLKAVLPLFSISLKQNADENQIRIQAIIKETYTSIHPTVEWKFLKAANNMLVQTEKNGSYEQQQIVFNDVYPLYGVTDVRGSSTERNAAIQSDLIEQISIASEVLDAARGVKPMYALDELIFRLKKYEKGLKQGLSSGDEIDILDYLHNSIEPLFKNFSEHCQDFKKKAAYYWKSLDNELGVVYKRRKAFEESLTTINEKLSSFLEKEQVKAQQIYPHYFEKYVTDGVEYNIYVGNSLTEGDHYDPIFLRNLRLWQIVMMVEVARKAERLKPELPIPLEATHLILVHNAPLSIKFRLEEKKFDVDGAYNIRYEIIKKRIDKSLIKGTDERLTQPGKIAIVYSNERDADEYMEYIEFLKSKKYLGKEVEKVELEELQGVSGLKALRIAIRDDKAVDPKALEGIDLEEALAQN
ncbi:MAG: GAF domain-containing protein [Cyclobacteriaceae bacterium]